MRIEDVQGRSSKHLNRISKEENKKMVHNKYSKIQFKKEKHLNLRI